MVVYRLERCAAESGRWAESNAVRFEISKTEDTLFLRRRKYWLAKAEKDIGVGDQTVRFAKDTTRWLGIWLDSAFILEENQRRCINRARQAKAKTRRLTTREGGARRKSSRGGAGSRKESDDGGGKAWRNRRGAA